MSQGIHAVKMSGAGNDFLVLGPEQERQLAGDLEGWVRRVCRRGLSVGADGVLFVEVAGTGHIGVRFHNPDGSQAFCGNGARCAARYAQRHGMAGASMVLRTAAGEVPAEVSGDVVRLLLPPPEDRRGVVVDVEGEPLAGRWITAGVPHFVVFVEDLAHAPLQRWGPIVRRHPCFGPEGTNLDLVQRLPEGALALRTWERGVEGETLACGSGAVAAAYAFRLEGGGEHTRLVPASGVALEVGLPGSRKAPESAILVGDARLIWEGQLSPEATTGFSAD